MPQTKYLKQNGETIYPVTTTNQVIGADGTTQFPLVYFNAQHTKGGGNVSFTGELLLDTILSDTANGWNSTTKRWTCPYKGLYFVAWSYFSNTPTTNGANRPTIYINGATRLVGSTQPANLSGIFLLNAGETISVGCHYGTGSLYSGTNHNAFQIVLIQKLD